jgi:acyl-CoA synthetase (AMP-forming)/AMP-acid ligase II
VGYPGLEMKIANTEDFDEELPQDGKAQGELMLRGPWVTSAYYRNPQPDKFHKVGAPGATLGGALAHGWRMGASARLLLEAPTHDYACNSARSRGHGPRAADLCLSGSPLVHAGLASDRGHCVYRPAGGHDHPRSVRIANRT